jgi:hypothetical protein
MSLSPGSQFISSLILRRTVVAAEEAKVDKNKKGKKRGGEAVNETSVLAADVTAEEGKDSDAKRLSRAARSTTGRRR